MYVCIPSPEERTAICVKFIVYTVGLHLFGGLTMLCGLKVAEFQELLYTH
jgi:hypothetical protein